jgi:GxxExxY protein
VNIRGTAKSIESINGISGKIVDAAVEVHKTLGPGLLESVYEVCLAHEASKRGLTFSR